MELSYSNWPYLASVAGSVLLFSFILQSSAAKNSLHRVVSQIINVYLCWWYPIKSRDGTRSIPTCPYEWPNGQGDVGKFLDGIENRDVWAEKHGVVYRIWNGMKPEIVVSRPEQIQTIFKDSNKHTKAVNNNTGWLLGALLGDCLGLISGDRWRNLHAVVNEPFKFNKISDSVAPVEERTRTFLQDLQSKDVKSKGINPSDDLRLLPFWIVADKIYGHLTPEMQRELEGMIPLRQDLFLRAIMGGWLRFRISKYIPSKTTRELKEFETKWEDFNERAYRRALKIQSKEAISPPIISMFQAVSDGKVTQAEILQTIDEMLFANLDVTIGGMSWALMFIASNQAIQDEVRREILEAKSNEKQWNEFILRSSTLLMASILESGRLKPLAPFSVPQSAPSDRVVADYVIPAGTDIVIDTYAINIRNPFWGKDADVFRPRRFIEHEVTNTRYHYWRYGFGPRICLGKYLSDLVIKSLVSQLLVKYRLELEGVDSDKDNWKRKPETWITQADTKIKCVPL